jgi:serine phosphatase RsbU (regulator of sigma subunit)
MEGKKFWDRNPKKFRIVVLLLTFIIVSAIVYNIINYASTVFSGTVYMNLPSKMYIKQKLYLKSKNNLSDTIPAGSFLLSINEKCAVTSSGYDSLLKSTDENSILVLRIFNVKKAKSFFDTTHSKYFELLADTFYIKKAELPNDFIKFLTTGSFLGYIVEGGATERAGLKVGDILLKIKDTEVKMMEKGGSGGFDIEFLKFFRNQPKDEPIPYTFLREGETLTFNVWIATFGIPTIAFLVVLCGMSFIGLGLYYGLKKPTLIPARLIFYAFLLIGAEICLSLNLNYPEFDKYTFSKILFTNYVIIFFLPLLFHSLIYFPDVNERLLNNKWHLRIFYSVAFITAALFTYFYFVNLSKLDDHLITFLLIGNIVYYSVVRIIYAKYLSTDKERLSKMISIIWIIIFISVFIFSILNVFGVKEFPPWVEYNFIFLFLIPISYLYFTWRYRLLDIDFHLRRNIQYVLLTVLWKSLLAGIFVFILWKISMLHLNFPNFKLTTTSIEILSIPLDSVTNIFYNKLLFILIAFVSGALLYKVGRSMQDFFDKKFYRQKFDYKYAQEELVRLFQKKFTIESLARVIVEKVSTLVRVKVAGVVFSGEGKKVWEGKMYCFNDKESKLYSLDFEQVYFDSIKGFNGTFSINYLPSESKNFLEGNKFLNIVPIKVNERLLGALFIGEKLSETPLRGEDFEFLSAIVTSTSIAVENAFLYEELTKRERIKKELEIAHNIQVASLPQEVPTIPGLDIFATSVPALEVGGDFYDFLNGSANGLTIVMGDVSGKGTSAALYMSKVQGIFQTLHEFNLSPVKLMTRANHLLYRHIDSKSYITAVGASFDTENNTLSFARAGHLPLYYYNHNLKEIRKLQPCGMGLGLSEKNIFDYSIEEIKIEYSKGDIFLFVSDGVIEALNRAGEQFGESKLLELIKLNTDFNSKNMVSEILDSVKTFTSDTSQYDDITLVAVKSV